MTSKRDIWRYFAKINKIDVKDLKAALCIKKANTSSQETVQSLISKGSDNKITLLSASTIFLNEFQQLLNMISSTFKPFM